MTTADDPRRFVPPQLGEAERRKRELFPDPETLSTAAGRYLREGAPGEPDPYRWDRAGSGGAEPIPGAGRMTSPTRRWSAGRCWRRSAM